MTAKRRTEPPCPQADQHTAGEPTGYVAWYEWAEDMSKTHQQRKCPGCGLYKIWIPKPGAEEEKEDPNPGHEPDISSVRPGETQTC